jgi:hypothetical protein
MHGANCILQVRGQEFPETEKRRLIAVSDLVGVCDEHSIPGRPPRGVFAGEQAGVAVSEGGDDFQEPIAGVIADVTSVNKCQQFT